MAKAWALLLALPIAAVALPLLRSRSSATASAPSFAPLPSPSVPLFVMPDLGVPDVRSDWQPNARSLPYLHAVRQSESKHGIPDNLLARLIEQESDWTPDAVGPPPALAQGIAQIVPRWHPNADPFNWSAAIDYAGKYLRENFDRFGTWQRALAAYNWGPTHVKNWIDAGETFARLPGETRNYISRILGDVPVEAIRA